MDKNTKERLDAAQKSRAIKIEKRRKKVEEIQSERATFLSEFAEKVSSVIEPTMQEMVDYLREAGHGCEIVSSTQADTDNSKDHAPSIRIDIFLENRRTAIPNQNWHPSVTFSAISYMNKVACHSAKLLTGGFGSGPKGEFELEAITTQLVNKLILEVLEGSMRA